MKQFLICFVAFFALSARCADGPGDDSQFSKIENKHLAIRTSIHGNDTHQRFVISIAMAKDLHVDLTREDLDVRFFDALNQELRPNSTMPDSGNLDAVEGRGIQQFLNCYFKSNTYDIIAEVKLTVLGKEYKLDRLRVRSAK